MFVSINEYFLVRKFCKRICNLRSLRRRVFVLRDLRRCMWA